MQKTIKKKRSKKRPNTIKRALDQQEAADYCGLAYRTMGDYYRAGIVQGSKPTGKKVFFDREKLDEFLLSGMNKSARQLESEAAAYVAKNK